MRQYLRLAPGLPQLPACEPGCWISMECPDDEDIRFLTHELGMPADFIEDINDVDERPRVEAGDGWLMTIVRIPMRSTTGNVPFLTVPVGLLTDSRVAVSVCYHRTDMMSEFISHTRARHIDIPDIPDLLVRVVYSSAHWSLQYLKEINRLSTEAEKQLERSIRNRDLLALMSLQKSMVWFSTSIKGNRAMAERLRSILEKRGALDSDLLEDVETELRQASDTVDIYSAILGGTMDTFASVISNNVNAIMKRMTSISITLMIPTLIASFFGMNVPMGWAGTGWWTFPAIIVVSALLSALSVVWFKRIKWF